MPQGLYVANWKMNLTRNEAVAFCHSFVEKTSSWGDLSDIGIAPPYTSFDVTKDALPCQKGIMLGAQNVHWLDSGAHTGEISGSMLKEMGAEFAIVGHSERRQFYGETDDTVCRRMHNALKHGLKAIVCIGETESQFKQGETKSVVLSQLTHSLGNLTEAQLNNIILAYEPVWAIGTGLAATPQIAQDVHALIRQYLIDSYGKERGLSVTILYGGSTKPDNIQELMACPDINGALVGGTSLKPDLFAHLIENGRKGDLQKSSC